jgi:mycothiol maleylpyruvate isomerase-like protein
MTARENFVGAANAVGDLVQRIDDDQWPQAGLGVWSVRELVGHTSRALVTVLTYLDRPAEREDLPTPEAYLTAITPSPGQDDEVAERGRQAARDLGDDPAGAFWALVRRAERRITAADDEQLVATIAGGMRLAAYLETRTFELVVHGGDIARATGLELALPTAALAEAAALAGRVAAVQGRGPELLAALTGRAPLPATFSLLSPRAAT